jgi:hypothetical protein
MVTFVYSVHSELLVSSLGASINIANHDGGVAVGGRVSIKCSSSNLVSYGAPIGKIRDVAQLWLELHSIIRQYLGQTICTRHHLLPRGLSSKRKDDT